jgi:Tfp pilus assembly protein PilX
MHTSMKHSSRRGSAILVTVLVTVCLSIIIFSILELGVFERRMNHHDRLMAQARYAAESVVENACAQAVRQLKLNSWVSSNYFSTNNTSASAYKFTALPDSFFANSQVDASSVRVKVPNMTTATIVTIPTESPDSLKGRPSKSAASPSTAKPPHAIAPATKPPPTARRLSRSAANPRPPHGLLQHGARARPGPDMVATGPFFSNKNIYFAASNSLKIQGTVTTPCDLRWGRIVEDGLNAWSASSAAQKGSVQIASGSADASGVYPLANFYKSGTYSDSLYTSTGTPWTDEKWQQYEQSQFKGNVQTRVDGVAERALPGLKNLADAHTVIESPIAIGAAGYDQEAELQKFANKAGIIIRPAVYSGGKSVTTKTKRTTVKNTKTGATTVTIDSTPTVSSTTTSFSQTKAASIWAYVPEGSQTGTYEGPYTRENEDGSLSKYYLVDITSKVTNLSTEIVTTTTGTSSSNSTATLASDLQNGFYDHREGTWMTMYNIDVAALKKAVASNTTLSKYWNGIVYVDTEGPTTTTTAGANEIGTPTSSGTNQTTQIDYIDVSTTTTANKSGVQLVNGGLGNLPQIPGRRPQSKASPLPPTTHSTSAAISTPTDRSIPAHRTTTATPTTRPQR